MLFFLNMYLNTYTTKSKKNETVPIMLFSELTHLERELHVGY